ncbi:hypothetical protein JKP88DRAFT_226448 [Tribonema minus]|uniref:Uncharacterized protein n=1 Tax=Tribonema minus TaxID=303371 RepID=A0A836C9H1_9STRA|nr:hypothetical protein JKP88DRAFT_226448 [Tribonema minus]
MATRRAAAATLLNIGRSVAVCGRPTATVPAACRSLHSLHGQALLRSSRLASPWGSTRSFAVYNNDEAIRRKMDEFNDLFVEAREEIQYAGESKETTYFNDEVKAAQAAVESALECFSELLNGVEEEQKQAIMRSNGLKVEQLKQELQLLMIEHEH